MLNILRKHESGIWDWLKIMGVILALLLSLRFSSEIVYLHKVVLEQGRTIETLLQAENDRLERELQQIREMSPAPVQQISENPADHVVTFIPVNVPLPEDTQFVVWSLCGEYPTFLSQQEFFKLVLKVMWNESRHQIDVGDNHNTNGSIDRGPMQINSINWEWLSDEGLDVNTIEGNIEAGVMILSRFLNAYQDVEYALTAYGKGPTRAKELGGRSALAQKIINLDLEEVQSIEQG